MRQAFTKPVTGASYSLAYRTIASLLCVAVIVQGAIAVARAPGVESFGTGALPWFGIALLALLATYALMMRARTTIDAAGLRQTGLIERRVDWAELHSARLAGFVVSRRLLVRSTSGQYRVFNGGTPALIAAFERIAQRYPVGGGGS
jgi:hypothetical protein